MDQKVFAGKYRAIRELSSEGTGRTWLAIGPDSEQFVVKVVHPADAPETDAIEHDVELVSGIRHAALPTIVEWGHQDGDLFVVREYVPGADMKTELSLQGRFAPLTVARYGIAAADALAQLHRRGVSHGNVRTANLVRMPSDDVKLVGSSLGVRDASTLGASGAPASAAWYLAPERVEGQPPSPSADIYALGAVLYELVTGRPPFEGADAAEVSDRQLHATPVSMSEFAADVPPELEQVIMRTLEKTPEARTPDAETLRAQLAAIEVAESTTSLAEPRKRKSKRGPWIAAAAALVVVIALVAAWALGLFGGRIAVPDVAGKTITQAKASITAAGLSVGKVTWSGVSVPGVADGLVSKQTPLAGDGVGAGTPVDIVLAGREMISVPDVAGGTDKQAKELIGAAGLTVGLITKVSTTAVEAGIVTSQTPQQGESVAKGSAVALWVAQAPPIVAIPLVSGLRQADASNALIAAGFLVKAVSVADQTVVSGTVIDQDPVAGVQAQTGSTVTIRVSSGPALTTVPNVKTKTQASAVNALTAAGFLTQVSLQTGGGTVGTVVTQNPASGTKAATGSTVIITVVQ